MLPETFQRAPAPNPDLVARALRELNRPLPADYLAFMRDANGGEGFVGEAYLVLWPLEQLAASNRQFADIDDVGDVVWFGGNGGGEAFGFDWAHDGAIVEGPMIGMERAQLLVCADSFTHFLANPTAFET